MGPVSTAIEVSPAPSEMVAIEWEYGFPTFDSNLNKNITTTYLNTLINAHQRSSTLINAHQRSSTLINAHQRSSTLINAHQRSSTLINNNQQSLTHPRRANTLTSRFALRPDGRDAFYCGGRARSQTIKTGGPILRSTLDNAEPVLRSTLVNAEPVLRSTLVDAEPVLRGTLDNAEPVLRSTFLHTQGSLAVRERKSYVAGLVAATAVVTEALKPAGKRGTL
ncbi:hypothetical protein N7449_004956 [Penicillium cf. viridicatum]|uniref:Uncharacterized protein n=1 Tax=Penicillium cf. viridicatum TaxID=2972119 RepID=A0A9W9SYM7_9EURO|nr:hypothetical protein N7449_004956 [Penicillium cf. viridicatum]